MKTQEGWYKKIRISAIREEIKDFKVFSFEEGHQIPYQSGQYLTLVRQIHQEEVRRSYSITAAPALGEPLSIGVKRIENGVFSRWLIDRARPGDALLTTGAAGFFVLPPDPRRYRQVFFFAAGSGITPVYSLIKTLLLEYPPIQLVLIFSNAAPSRTIFFQSLLEWKERFPGRFQIEFLFSNEPDLSRARLHRELVRQFIEGLSAAPVTETLYYICGPLAYMRMCTYSLQELGIPPENIRKENFNIESFRVPLTPPPDRASHNATLHFGSQTFRIRVNYPDSILQSARKQGISLPYSCEVGRCGNCAARCIHGRVWHSYNEVLTDKELQEGLVLTCVGHPVGGDVELDLKKTV